MSKKFDYEKKISGEKEISFAPLLRQDYLIKELRSVSGKVLDVGCGAGYNPGRLKNKRPNLKIYGVDISQKAIQTAKKDFPDVNFSVASADKLPFPDNNFGACIMINVLEHLEDPSKALAELKRVLKPAGLFYSMTPLEGDRFVLSSSRALSEKYQGHLQRFSSNQILSLLKNEGFRLEKHFFCGFLLCQAVGWAYYILLDFLHLPPHYSVKSHLIHGNHSLSKLPLALLRELVYLGINLESFIVPKRIPGLFIHILARKY